MTKRIIYKTNEGGVVVIIPSGELPLKEVARKDVPAGVPYKIIDTLDVPDDRTFRSAWEADMTSPHGVGIGQQAWFIEQHNAEIAAINAEPTPAQGVEQTDEEHAAIVTQWKASKAARIAQLNTQIAVQRAEMEAA